MHPTVSSAQRPPSGAIAQRSRLVLMLPVPNEDRRGWGLASLLFHGLLVFLLLAPASANHEGSVIAFPQGAGGPGPSGGGGGGRQGTGGVQRPTEHLEFVHVAPPPPKPVIAPKPAIEPP